MMIIKFLLVVLSFTVSIRDMCKLKQLPNEALTPESNIKKGRTYLTRSALLDFVLMWGMIYVFVPKGEAVEGTGIEIAVAILVALFYGVPYIVNSRRWYKRFEQYLDNLPNDIPYAKYKYLNIHAPFLLFKILFVLVATMLLVEG